MNSLIKSLADETPMLGALIVAVAAAFGASDSWKKVVLAAVPLLMGLLVRQVTSSPSTLAGAVTSAATKTAAALTEVTAGAVGEVTAGATAVVDGVTTEVLGAVGGAVPALTIGGNP